MAPATVAKSCATKAGWTDWDEINACTTSDLGNQLMHSIAQVCHASALHTCTPSQREEHVCLICIVFDQI